MMRSFSSQLIWRERLHHMCCQYAPRTIIPYPNDLSVASAPDYLSLAVIAAELLDAQRQTLTCGASTYSNSGVAFSNQRPGSTTTVRTVRLSLVSGATNLAGFCWRSRTEVGRAQIPRISSALWREAVEQGLKHGCVLQQPDIVSDSTHSRKCYRIVPETTVSGRSSP